MRRVMQPALNNPRAASQTDQEAASSGTVFVAPTVQHYHQSAAKAWAHFLNSGTPFLVSNASYNIATVSGAGGFYPVTFTNQMSTTQYVVVGMTESTTSVAGARPMSFFNLTSAGFTFIVDNNASSNTSGWSKASFAVYGDLP